MKKLLMIAVVTFASASAFATKARLNSLSYPMSRHLTDVQTIFVNPSDLTLMGSWVTFETGSSNLSGVAPATTPSAEAGFARAVGDARWGFYIGHTGTGLASDTFARGGVLRPAGFLIEENPLNIFYAMKAGEMSWGLGVNYSNTDRRLAPGFTSAASQSSLGATVGVRMGFLDASLDLDITDKAELAGTKWEGKTGGDLRVGYVMDTMYAYGQYQMAAGSQSGTTVNDIENNAASIGVINTTKAEGSEFFYGAALMMSTLKSTPQKVETLSLPVVIGIEADAASWLVLRGSVTQTVLLDQRKTSPAAGASTDGTGANNTRVAVGTGMKFNKFMLDTTLAGSTTGNVNGTELLAQAGLVYNF